MKVPFLLLLLLPLACLAQKKLVPVEYQTYSGADIYSVVEADGITVFAESFEIRKGIMIFDLEVKNHSGEFLLIDPQLMYFYGSDTPFPDYSDDSWEDEYIEKSGDFYPLFAQSQRSVNQFYERKNKSKQNTKNVLLLLGTALIVYDAVKDGQDWNSEPTPRRVNNSFARDVTVTTGLMAMDIVDDALSESQARIDEDLYYLPDEYLPRVDLETERAVRGKIYFNPSEKFKYYRLMVPIADFVMVFDFRWPSWEERQAIRGL